MKHWQWVCLVLAVAAAIANPKMQLFHVIKKQLSIYKNYRTQKISVIDITTFIMIPIAIGYIVGTNLPIEKITDNAGTVITIFSLIATLPLSFLALFIDKILEKKAEKEVAKEAFVSITLDIVYAIWLIALVAFSALTEMPNTAQKIAVGIMAFFVTKIVFNIFMILKRVFNIWEKD